VRLASRKLEVVGPPLLAGRYQAVGISEHPEAHIEGTSRKLAILPTMAREGLIRWDCF
jgi:hypothetical protein